MPYIPVGRAKDRRRAENRPLTQLQQRVLDCVKAGLTSRATAEIVDRPGQQVRQIRDELVNRGLCVKVPERRGRPPKQAAGQAPVYFAEDDGVDDMSGERCRCGLRLPCLNCLPRSAAELAQQRRSHYSDDIGEKNGYMHHRGEGQERQIDGQFGKRRAT